MARNAGAADKIVNEITCECGEVVNVRADAGVFASRLNNDNRYETLKRWHCGNCGQEFERVNDSKAIEI